MKTILLTVALALPFSASAQQVYTLQEVCMGFADVALTSRALALEGVKPESATKILARMYTGRGVDDSVRATIEQIKKAAFASTLEASQFAQQVMSVCMSKSTEI